MRPIVALATGILALAAYTSPAQAIDCRKASSTVEHLICGDRRLETADAAMGKAYAEILKVTDDPEIHTMLVNSQKRWLKTRDSQLGEVFPFIVENLDEPPGKAVVQRNLLVAIQDRTKGLSARSKTDPKVPRLIEIALGQRAFAAQYTGGPFAGISADCDFFPSTHVDAGPYGYSCFASRSYQNKNRVCRVSEDWATYRIYDSGEIADVVDGKLKTVATCGNNGPPCPAGDATGDRSDWDMHPDAPGGAKGASSKEASDATTPANVKSSPALDADAGPDEALPWLHACLTDPSYPPAAPPDDVAKRPN
jgi:uncharacterized protein YecT (DUF1311 family)